MMTFRQLAREVARLEKKKVQVNIAQISEVLSKTIRILSEEFRKDPYGFVSWLGRYTDTLEQFKVSPRHVSSDQHNS